MTGDAIVAAGQVAFVGSAAQMAEPLSQQEAERIAYRHQLADFEADMAAADLESDEDGESHGEAAHAKRVGTCCCACNGVPLCRPGVFPAGSPGYEALAGTQFSAVQLYQCQSYTGSQGRRMPCRWLHVIRAAGASPDRRWASGHRWWTVACGSTMTATLPSCSWRV